MPWAAAPCTFGAYFNGELFADARVLELTADEIKTMSQAADFNWSVVNPAAAFSPRSG